MYRSKVSSYLGACAAVGLMAVGLSSSASAQQPELSANVALTSDYVFRGFSQTDENAAIQGGIDASAGMFYIGTWGSNLDFGGDGNGNDVANMELDIYAGITPKLGNIEFDLGVIYYLYPNAVDDGAELDFIEIKAGASTSIGDNLTVGTTLYYSPEYTGEIGKNWVLEGTAEVSLPKIGGLSPALSGTVGHQWGEENAGGFDYTYWNAGVSVGFAEKFTLDVRYWDTASLSGCSTATIFQCDGRVVGTLSAEF